MARFNGSQVARPEWVGVGAGALALVVSFFSWRHVKGAADSPNVSDLLGTLGVKSWYTAWGSGLLGWLPVALLVGAAALILAPGFGLRIRGVPFLWLAMAAAAFVIIIIRWTTLPTPDADLLARFNLRPEDIGTGASIGLYLGLIAAAISVLGAVLRVLSALKPTTTTYSPPAQNPPTEPLG